MAASTSKSLVNRLVVFLDGISMNMIFPCIKRQRTVYESTIPQSFQLVESVMPYSSHAHSRPVASLLGTLSSLRTNLDVLLIPFYSKLTMPDVDLNGKLAVVTGANSGIGFEAARALATMGAHVILACRSESKGEEARKKIVESTGSPKVELEILDCGKFASVHAFLERWEKREIKQVDILINNAGKWLTWIALG